MIIPNYLKKGDKVGILSTARKISFQELKYAINLLEKWGLIVEFGDHLLGNYNQFSGTIEERTSDLQNMINRNDIKAIFCARGGYGTIQIIDNIDFSNLKNNPKWIVGYSDITVLHSHLNNLGIATIHATMPINFSNNTKASLDSIYNTLFKKENSIIHKSFDINQKGFVKGEIIGGNLSIIYSLIGSKSDICTEGKILFIEDVDEYLYHIDRMIISLARNKKFEKLKALIIGSMTDMNDNSIPFGKKANDIILSHTKKYGYPICFNFPSGHLNNNKTIVFGVKSLLRIEENDVALHQLL